MSLSKSLRRLIAEKELSVAQVSQMSGVPVKTIYHWLNGQQPRKIEHLFSICDVLNITLDELYGRQKTSDPLFISINSPYLHKGRHEAPSLQPKRE